MTDTAEIMWLSLKEATTRVASRSTIYRRIDAGEYRSEKRQARVFVGVPSSHVVEWDDETEGTDGTSETFHETSGMCRGAHGTSHGAEERPSAVVAQVSDEHDALVQEVEILHLKLQHSEREHESTRQESDTLRSDVEHLRGMNTQQADTIQNLTEEIKGLTIALHHEQGQRLELAAHIEEKDEEEKPKKDGLLRRVFTRKRKKRFARVGPSPTRSG